MGSERVGGSVSSRPYLSRITKWDGGATPVARDWLKEESQTEISIGRNTDIYVYLRRGISQRPSFPSQMIRKPSR